MTGEIVVTGLGLITALGANAASSWEELVRGRSAVRRLRRFDPPAGRCQAAAEIEALEVPGRLRVPKHVKFMGRATLCAVHAALEAVATASIDLARIDPYRVAILVGSGETGLDPEEFFPALTAAWEDDPTLDYRALGGPASRLVDPYFSLRTLSNAAAALLAIELEARGASGNFVQGPTASAHALAAAHGELTEGRADVVLAVGCDALVNVATWLALDRAGRLSRLDPTHACRPFDADCDGFVLGEAGVALVLERRADAERRGAAVLGGLAGVGFAADVCSDIDATSRPALAPGVPIRPSGGSAPRRALEDAGGLGGGPPGFVVAFGEATPAGDAREAAEIDDLFGRAVPVTACTGALGHLGAATSLVQVAIALLALKHWLVPPVVRLDRPGDGLSIDVVVGTPRSISPRAGTTALCLSRDVLGLNAAVVVAAA